eukprot:4094310-Pyramimonas_sp.AAC.1
MIHNAIVHSTVQHSMQQHRAAEHGTARRGAAPLPAPGAVSPPWAASALPLPVVQRSRSSTMPCPALL